MFPQRPWNDSRRMLLPPAVVEREIEILAVDNGRVTLRAVSDCSDCSGCGGRCNVFSRVSSTGVSMLPLPAFERAPQPGERWRLVLPTQALLRQSVRLYGAALTGLLLGALLGHSVATLLPFPTDLSTAVAAVLGTLTALRLSNRGSDVHAFPVVQSSASIADAAPR